MFDRSRLRAACTKLMVAIAIVFVSLFTYVKISNTGSALSEGEVQVNSALWVDETGNARPIKMGIGTPFGMEPGAPCCEGRYQFDLGSAVKKVQQANPRVVPALYLSAMSCGIDASVGEQKFSLDDSEFSIVGPVIPLSTHLKDDGEPLLVEITMSCAKSILSGLWRAPPVVGDFSQLVKRQRSDRAFQANLPLASALIFGVFAVMFGIVYFSTERTFAHYRDVALSLVLWSIFLLFLAGVPRGWSFAVGAAVHMPMRIVTLASTFLVLGSYNEIFCGRVLSPRARYVTLGSMFSLFVICFIFELTDHPTVVTILASGGMLGFWPLIYWPLDRIKFASLSFAVFCVSLIAVTGCALDSYKLLMARFGGSPLPFFNRVTSNLFMVVALVTFLRHFIWLYRDRKDVALRAAKAGAVRRAIQLVAHDVRKPFTTLRFGLESLRRNIHNPVRLEHSLMQLSQDLAKKILRVNGMLNDIMHWNPAAQISRDAVDVELLLKDVHSEIVACHPRAESRVSVECTTKFWMEIDRAKMFRVLFNIAENAIQASGPNDRVVIRASPTSERSGYSMIVIHNTGSFISAERREKIFEDFFTEGKVGGNGLGLAISKDVVGLHGGFIVCQSDPLHGTGFVIELPSVINSGT